MDSEEESRAFCPMVDHSHAVDLFAATLDSTAVAEPTTTGIVVWLIILHHLLDYYYYY